MLGSIAACFSGQASARISGLPNPLIVFLGGLSWSPSGSVIPPLPCAQPHTEALETAEPYTTQQCLSHHAVHPTLPCSRIHATQPYTNELRQVSRSWDTTDLESTSAARLPRAWSPSHRHAVETPDAPTSGGPGHSSSDAWPPHTPVTRPP